MVAYSFGLVGQLGKNRDTFSQSTPPFTFDYPQLSAIPPPVEYSFPIWEELTETSYGRTLISLIHYLFAVAEEYL